MVFASVAEASPDAAKRCRHLRRRVLQHWDQAEQQPSQERNDECKTQYHRIDSDFTQPRQRLRSPCHQDAKRSVGEAQPERATQNPQHRAFEQHLTRDRSPVSAQRGSNGHLVLTALRAHQQ
jgi:hypothetical protein